MERFERLGNWLTEALGPTEITSLKKMSGGAIQENWLLETDTGDYVLRTDAPSTLSTSHSRPEEFAILKAAHDAGVMAPKPLALCEDTRIIGAPFYLMERATGMAQARKIVRDPELADFGPALVKTLGEQLATLHRIKPARADLAFLTIPENPAQHRIDGYRRDLDALSEGHPVLEYALNWLEDNRPSPQDVRFCHSDYRTGNFMVQNGQLTAILDWEFACWSDPMEDLGWLCATCWRFGNNHLEVGGLSTLDAFLEGYEGITGTPTDRAVIPYWQVMAELRWAVIALQQAERSHDGEPTLELALSGPLAAEMEWNILNLLDRLDP